MTQQEILTMVGAEWALIYMNDNTVGPEHIIGYSECPTCKQRTKKEWVYEYPGIPLNKLLSLWEGRYHICWNCNQRLRSAPALSSGQTTGREPALPCLWNREDELPF